MVQWYYSIMRPMSQSGLRILAALSLTLVLGLARAQDNEPVDPDPPDRAARLSFIQGEVSMQPAGEDDWAPALLNRPLTTGDKLWTEPGARAEVQVGPAAVRLDGDTGFSFLNVDDDTIQMRMTAGVVNVRVRWLEKDDHIEIDTPNVALSLVRPGNYRVEVNDAGDTTVLKISEGEAQADGPGQRNVVVRNQQIATFRGVDNLTAQYATLGAPDEFDSWSLERDRRDDRVAGTPTSEYVSPDVTGYEDLNDNGSWASEPEYGYVWTPSRVAVGWAPYQYGRWAWISPWGWTWIDDAPWGYAPFHYGRWAYLRQRWCWVPGPRHVRAVYAPALVGWVGSPGFGVSVSVGNVGWFPLGPREVYVPARRYSHRYFERVNVSNTVIVNRTYITNVYNNRGRDQHYRNRAVPGAVTTVSRNTFTSAGRVADHRVRVDDREMGRWRTAAVPPQIAPVRESRYGGAPRGNLRPPPRAVVDRPVVVNRAPPSSSERFTRRVEDRLGASREPQSAPRPQARPDRPDRPDRVDRPDRNRRDGAPPEVRNRTDRPRTETSAPKTPPNVGYADSQRLQTGRPQMERPQAEERRNDRPPREQREQYQRDRQQDSQRPVRDVQEQQRRQAEFQQRQQQREVQQRDVQQRETQQREVQQREFRQRESQQRQQQDAARQEAARRDGAARQAQQVEQRERATERPRSEAPRVQQRPQEDRSNRVQRAQESRQLKRQDDTGRARRN
jgi:hypothetical protein